MGGGAATSSKARLDGKQRSGIDSRLTWEGTDDRIQSWAFLCDIVGARESSLKGETRASSSVVYVVLITRSDHTHNNRPM